MKQTIIVAYLLVTAILAGSTAVFSQEQSSDDVIKVKTTFVSIPVIVSDRQGRYISGLKASDFSLFQDGVKQNIDFFAPTEEPLNVALLIDTSRSTIPVLDDIKDAAINFVKQLQPRDRAMIVSFDFETQVLTPLTSDRKELTRAIKNAEIGEIAGTTLRDAVMETVTRSFADIKGRKAIVLLTDGKDARSEVSEPQLMRSIEESDTMIYSIFYQTGGRAAARNGNNRRMDRFPQQWPGRRGGRGGRGIFNRRFPDDDRFPQPRFPDERTQQRNERVTRANAEAEGFLQELSDSTAGRFYRSEVGDLKKTFGLIINELRYQYRLGFYPPENNQNEVSHEIKVRVAQPPEAIVRARRNYRIER